MDWFASALQSSCVTELAQRHALATSTLTALLAYPLLRSAACLTSPATDAYCYLSAVRGKSPQDAFAFGVPLGEPLPAKQPPSCGACTKSLMAAYAGALGALGATPTPDAGVTGGTNATSGAASAAAVGRYDALRAVYPAAADVVSGVCGAEFVQNAAAG
jgi:hypothetical protein